VQPRRSTLDPELQPFGPSRLLVRGAANADLDREGCALAMANHVNRCDLRRDEKGFICRSPRIDRDGRSFRHRRLITVIEPRLAFDSTSVFDGSPVRLSSVVPVGGETAGSRLLGHLAMSPAATMRHSLVKIIVAALVLVGAIVVGTGAIVYILRGGTLERPEQQRPPPAESDVVTDAPGPDNTITTPPPTPPPETPRSDDAAAANRGKGSST